MLCLNNHKNHKIILLLDFIPSKNYINELKSKIGNFNEIRKYKNEIIQSLKDEIDLLEKSYLEYEKNMQLQVSLINNLIFTYNFEEKLNNYNFEIIENLKIIETIKFPSPDFKNCKNVFEKAEYFLLFMGIKEKKKNKIQTNFNLLHSNIFSNVNKHTDKINQIIILKDGRIASSSNDSSILIYNKEMNNIDIMIKEHKKNF
jgi:exonuclease VII small subunit